MLLLIDIFSINKGRGYENPSLEIIVTEHCSTGGCPLEEACEHCFLTQSKGGTHFEERVVGGERSHIPRDL
jgi:hypothetical protein